MLISNLSKRMSQLVFNRMFSSGARSTKNFLNNYDETQVKFMEEPCILLNDQDEYIGTATKKDCHTLEENTNKCKLHRAFSVFLFNTNNELLLQQRSPEKITFPGLWTNTCCSHPLDTELETDIVDAMGVKRAAQRKLYHELGITPDQIPLTIFSYITRIQYSAENIPNDGIFGENEIDYVLIVQKDVDLRINENEVKSYEYVSQEKLQEYLRRSENGDVFLTPWFRLISDKLLFNWWGNLHTLKTLEDHTSIHKLN